MSLLSVFQWLQTHSVVMVLVVFVLLVVTTYWPGRRSRFDNDAMIPFRDSPSGDVPQRNRPLRHQG